MSHHPYETEATPVAKEVIANADTIVSSEEWTEAQAGVPELQAGDRIGDRYQVLKLLGAGGMGAVYLARDDELDDLVAIKLLHGAVAASPAAVELLRKEVRLARRVTHRNVARIFELGEYDGRRFLTMEYIDGESLAVLMRRTGRLSLSRTLQILTALCRGLQAAHDAQVIHRDIKPDNVLVSHRGRVVLSDFGIAHACKEGTAADTTVAAGTPAYMAPELFTGGEVSQRTDVYSLGVMAFEMLTGELPWKFVDEKLGRLAAPPPDPRVAVAELPEGLAAVVVRALSRFPEERFSSPAEFARELEAAISVTIRGDSRTPAYSLTPARRDADAGKKAVAVLPFQNRGPSDADALLARGFTEDLIDCLCGVGELRVLSRGATVRFADDPREAHEIGRELGVSLVVEGSLQRGGDTLQIRVRAIDVADGMQIWAQRYRVAPEELLSTSDEVTAALTTALGPKKPVPRQSAMPSAAATELYLRAKDRYRRFEPIAETLDLFEEALRQAPDSPLINAGYAMALLRAWMLIPRDTMGYGERAREAAERAATAGPHLGDPQMALGLLALHNGDPVGAVRGFRTAIALAPSTAQAHAFLGEQLAEIGRIPEAMRRLDAATSLDPTSHYPNAPRRRAAALLGEWERAYALAEDAPPVTTPLGWMLTMRIAAYRGDRELLAHIADDLERLPMDPYRMKPMMQGQVAVYLGRRSATEVYELMRTSGFTAGMSCRRLANERQFAAEVAAFAGEAERTFDLIDEAMEFGFVDLFWLERCPLMDDLREHRRYAALHKRVQERAFAAFDAFWGR